MPLSDHEQRLLAQLEEQLRADDPKFADSLASERRRPVTTRHIVVGSLIGFVGILVLLVGVALQSIWVGVLGFLVMGAGVYWGVFGGFRKFSGHGGKENGKKNAGKKNGSGKGGQRGSFMNKLDERWDERRRDQ